MKTTSARFGVACGLLLMPGLLAAQEKTPYQPRLTNSKNGALHDFPMGVLSATGRLTHGEREILVKHVGLLGVAERGGLKAGDRIVSIRGKVPEPFSKSTETGLTGPQAALGHALDSACASDERRLDLEVRRGADKIDLQLALPGSPAFTDSFPRDCPKSKAYLAAIADHLVATQQASGRWRPGVGGDADVYMSAFCALALLAADRESDLPSVRRAIDFIRRASIAQIRKDDPKAGPKSWQTASSAVLLAEYQLATGDTTYLEDLKTCCKLLADRVTGNGTMGHHYEVPYGGGGLVIINVQAHLAWALAEKCGVAVDQVAWDRSLAEIRKSIDRRTGAIGYSARAPGSPDFCARTGAMAAALAIAGKEPDLVEQFARALVAHQGRMRHAHAMSSIGFIYGFSGLKLADPEGHKNVMREWKPYLELCRTSAGSAAYFGGKRNIGGDEYLGLPPIGNAIVALMLASAEEKLFMMGGTRKGWFGGTP